MTENADETPVTTETRKRSPWLGLLPFLGVILFVAHTLIYVSGGVGPHWQTDLLSYAVYYMVGVAGIGAGIAHVFFGKAISKSIGFQRSPFQLEVGFADFAMGVAGIMSASFGPEFWWATIVVSSVFRVLAGVGHIVQIVRERNYAINNTAILFVNFVVPAFLVWAYFAWS